MSCEGPRFGVAPLQPGQARTFDEVKKARDVIVGFLGVQVAVHEFGVGQAGCCLPWALVRVPLGEALHQEARGFEFFFDGETGREPGLEGARHALDLEPTDGAVDHDHKHAAWCEDFAQLRERPHGIFEVVYDARAVDHIEATSRHLQSCQGGEVQGLNPGVAQTTACDFLAGVLKGTLTDVDAQDGGIGVQAGAGHQAHTAATAGVEDLQGASWFAAQTAHAQDPPQAEPRAQHGGAF